MFFSWPPFPFVSQDFPTACQVPLFLSSHDMHKEFVFAFSLNAGLCFIKLPVLIFPSSSGNTFVLCEMYKINET